MQASRVSAVCHLTPLSSRNRLQVDLIRITEGAEALSKPADRAEPFIAVAQEQNSCIGRDHFSVEFGDNFSPTAGLERERSRVTLCYYRTSVCCRWKAICTNHLR